MPQLDTARARELLRQADFRRLFVEELGWERHNATLRVVVGGQQLMLHSVAQKREFAVLVCDPDADGQIPDYAARRKIDHQVGKSHYEHIIIYRDREAATQVWQWVKRPGPGRPKIVREQFYDVRKGGTPLLQKLERLVFTLDEEASVTLLEVLTRAQGAFDVQRITKRFYDQFKQEHDAFLEFVDGITKRADREWYASVMLNRLMFVYFIQKKGFLDGDQDYLRNRLRIMQERRGRDKFLTFYRHFLLRLFHDGLGKKHRSRELDELLGHVPYMNGGLFLPHQIEDEYPSIQIPDEAFEGIFAFFEQYQWHLDERPRRADNEINPDVIGYIFEKYINQQEFGAYYTREDVTEYMCKSTIVPRVFDLVAKEVPASFERGGQIWRMLDADPDRYIYDAMKTGVNRPLPAAIMRGLTDRHERAEWARPAAEDVSLPTETWREVITRRAHVDRLRKLVSSGAVRSWATMIEYNLDVRQFAQDIIENCQDANLLRVIFRAIRGLTVLDPTCGSGAFLFAALNILEPLYEAVIQRMNAFLADAEFSQDSAEQLADFWGVIAEVQKHRSTKYFIYKSIVLNNLYGVDLMEEATEICKLRLFLKLVAQVERVEDVEPLPDIDFNVRAGNTLVGFTSAREIDNGALDLFGAAKAIKQRAQEIDDLFREFRKEQTAANAAANIGDKLELSRRLKALEAEINEHLARDYGVSPKAKNSFQTWLSTHQPFHWFVDFYGIMERGGFDVVVGNPPYIVHNDANIKYTIREQDFETFSAKNLYAFVFERSVALAQADAPVCLIVQLTVLSSERLQVLQDLLARRGPMFTPAFPRRPESIFDGVEMPVAIVLSLPVQKIPHREAASVSCYVTSRVERFYTEEREHALFTMALTSHAIKLDGYRIAKIGSELEQAIVRNLMTGARAGLGSLAVKTRSNWILYYQEACRYWVKASKGLPFFKRNGKKMEPPHGRVIPFSNESAAALALCVLNSSLFYWYYSAFADCEHINDGLVRRFPIPADWEKTDWLTLADDLSESLSANARRKVIMTKQGHRIEYDEMRAACSKPVIDRIDIVLGSHYDLAPEQLDFIVNYDLKYRMGDSGEVVDA